MPQFGEERLNADNLRVLLDYLASLKGAPQAKTGS
jgi:hypothetical protein